MDNVEYWKNEWEIEYKIVNGKLELEDVIHNEYLNIRNCTSLISLPDNLTVSDSLDLLGCTSLISLPDNLIVKGYLDLGFCTSIKSLSDNLIVEGDILLSGCTSIKHIGKNNLFHGIYFDEYSISLKYNFLCINYEIPISIKQSYIGKRVIDLIDDPRIYGTRYAEAIVTGLYDDGDFVIDLKGDEQ